MRLPLGRFFALRLPRRPSPDAAAGNGATSIAVSRTSSDVRGTPSTLISNCAPKLACHQAVPPLPAFSNRVCRMWAVRGRGHDLIRSRLVLSIIVSKWEGTMRSDIDRQMLINRLLFGVIIAVALALASAKIIYKIAL